MFILKKINIEAKRTDSLVRKFISKRSENVYIKDFKYRSEAKQVNIKMWIQRSEANWFISKLHNIEAKRTGSLVIVYLKSRKKANFRFF